MQLESFLIGTGRLTWDASERRSDRYGAIYLIEYGDSRSRGEVPYVPLNLDGLQGKRVRLLAKVIETRESTHIGDLFHGIFPRTPIAGECISLGDGTLRSGRNYGGSPTVELHPADGRETQWMSMRGLYDTHEQTVELYAEVLP